MDACPANFVGRPLGRNPPLDLVLSFAGIGSAPLTGFDGWLADPFLTSLVGDGTDGVIVQANGENTSNVHPLGVTIPNARPWRVGATFDVFEFIDSEADLFVGFGTFSSFVVRLSYTASPSITGPSFISLADDNGFDSGLIDVGTGVTGSVAIEARWDGSVYVIRFNGVDVFTSSPVSPSLGAIGQVFLDQFESTPSFDLTGSSVEVHA